MTFEEADKIARGPEGNRMTLWPNRAAWLYESAKSVAHLNGEFWECGVYRGGSAKLVSEVLKAFGHDQILRLFDTFEGFKNITTDDGDFHAAKDGEMKYWSNVDAAVADIQTFLNSNFVRVHAGVVPDSLQQFDNSRIAYAYLDMDLYDATLGAMKFVLPRMVPGGVIVIDDCGDKNWPGVEKAVRETKGTLELEIRSCINPYEPVETAYVGWRGEIKIP